MPQHCDRDLAFLLHIHRHVVLSDPELEIILIDVGSSDSAPHIPLHYLLPFRRITSVFGGRGFSHILLTRLTNRTTDLTLYFWTALLSIVKKHTHMYVTDSICYLRVVIKLSLCYIDVFRFIVVNGVMC